MLGQPPPVPEGVDELTVTLAEGGVRQRPLLGRPSGERFSPHRADVREVQVERDRRGDPRGRPDRAVFVNSSTSISTVPFTFSSTWIRRPSGSVILPQPPGQRERRLPLGRSLSAAARSAGERSQPWAAYDRHRNRASTTVPRHPTRPPVRHAAPVATRARPAIAAPRTGAPGPGPAPLAPISVHRPPNRSDPPRTVNQSQALPRSRLWAWPSGAARRRGSAVPYTAQGRR